MFLTLLLLLPLPQDSAPQDPPRPAVEPFFAVQWAGLESAFVDPKDVSLRNALQLVDDRLLEVLTELGVDDLPPGTIELVTELLAGPVSLTIDLDSKPIPGMPFPVVGELLVSRDSEEAAQALTSHLVSWFGNLGMELPTPAPGEISVLPAPVPTWMGTDGGDFFIRLGREEGLEAPSLTRLVPEGSTISFSGRMDYGGLMLEVMKSQELEGDGGEELTELFDALGLTDMVYEWAVASDDKVQYLVFNMPGWGKTAIELGMLPEEPLTLDFLRVIPADATWAYAFSFDLRGILAYYERLFAAVDEGEDLVAMIESELGIDVEKEILAPFGTRGCLYASETTGGGGAMSMVLVLQLADREAFGKTMARVKDAVNGPLAELAQEYVCFDSRRSAEGLEVSTVTFPGLPVPFELTVIALANHAVVALTPQAAWAAVSHMTSPESSLPYNAAFREQLPASLEGCSTIHFVDTPRLLRDGYGTMSLLCAALANGVRSPSDAERDPGLILPGYRELGRGAKAIVGTVRVVGDDLLTEYRGDRSQLVNATGITGMLFNGPILPIMATGLMASLVVPRTVLSLEAAREGKVHADIRLIHEALGEYAIANDGHYPQSLEELVRPDENGTSFLRDAEGIIDPWGEPYRYRAPTEDDPRPEVWCASLEEF